MSYHDDCDLVVSECVSHHGDFDLQVSECAQ